MASFKKGNSLSDITEDTSVGVVYAANEGTTYSFADGKLDIDSKQNAETDDWTATQVFARSIRTKIGGNYTLSFDLKSNVTGVIQVASNFIDPIGFEIKAGDNHIVLEKNIFEGNYADLTIVFGAHLTVQQPQKNIGAFKATISNFSFVQSATEDVISPVIKLNSTKTYFTGDTLDVMKSVTVSDTRDNNPTLSIVSEESNVPIVDKDNVLTTAGEYYVMFKAVDASGNIKKFKAFFLVKALPTGTDNFAIQSVEYGEEWQLNDPTVCLLWNEQSVMVTRERLSDTGFKFTSDQKKSAPWYATQLFFRSLKVKEFGIYKLSYTIHSDVAGTIKLDGSAYNLQVGDNVYEKTLPLTKDNYYKASIQFNKEDTGNIGACSIEVKNLALKLQANDNTTWTANGMTATKNDTDNVISYSAIPNNWWEDNARVYDFSDKTKMTALRINFTGTKDQTYQFKLEGLDQSNYEKVEVKATGEKQYAVINLINRTKDQKKE